jgi:uncharacterized protein (DUF2252 family)
MASMPPSRPVGKNGSNPRSPSEGVKSGKAARKRAPRSSQAAWEPNGERRSPVDVLAGEDETRVPELVPVRYGRMLTSAFTFYRGAAGIMAADLASQPDSGLRAQLCGDAHLSNFGSFEAPDRRLVFDINDFDETIPGPFEWDVKRLAASVAIGGRDRGFSLGERRAAALAAVREYRKAMRSFAAMREIDVWYSRLNVDEIADRWQGKVTKEDRKRFDKTVAKARNKDSLRALRRLTESSNGDLRIASRPPVLTPIEELAEGQSVEAINAAMEQLLDEYRQTLEDQSRALAERYRYVHAGRKVVGVGSVGTRAWIALLVGRDNSDPLFLQVKEAEASVLEPFAGASRFRHHGHRVVAGQRLMQAAGDVLLGWLTADGLDGKRRDFYVRQLWDGKGSAEIELMGSQTMAGYAGLCGWCLARAHARSGDRIAIASYLGKGDAFDHALADFAEAYADQNESDYQALLEAERSGKVMVESGV